MAADPGDGGGVLHVVLLKPSHYDDRGYPIQFQKSAMPSNTLACLYALIEDAQARRALGDAIEIRPHAIDEANQRIRPARIIEGIRASGHRALIALVGVQSNQFDRAVDIAKPFLAAGLPVCMGGFHVSGCIAMLPQWPQEMLDAQAIGISFFAGEAEGGRLDDVLKNAWSGTLKPIYNHVGATPAVAGQPPPYLGPALVDRVYSNMSSFDLGRGCPFQCSFCTIINVHGRRSRHRSPADVEQLLRRSYAQGMRHFFITDDDFARNLGWEPLVDRIIELREKEGMLFNFIIQVDTQCHQIPNFIEKCTRAGVSRVFIGLENINPDNLLEARKKQNRITEYRKMLQKWRAHGALTYAGYILGFPADTKESILRDIEIVKRELPVDLLEFFYLTPLPGSEDHKRFCQEGMWMDPDLNKFDLTHRVTHHPKMSDAEWEEAFAEAWRSFYSPEHIRTIVRRAAATPGFPLTELRNLIMLFSMSFDVEGLHPLETGTWRMYFREDRRPGLPIEEQEEFMRRTRLESEQKTARYIIAKRFIDGIYDEVLRSPDRQTYTDIALSPQNDEEFDSLELYHAPRGAEAALARERRKRAAGSASRPVQGVENP